MVLVCTAMQVLPTNKLDQGVLFVLLGSTHSLLNFKLCLRWWCGKMYHLQVYLAHHLFVPIKGWMEGGDCRDCSGGMATKSATVGIRHVDLPPCLSEDSEQNHVLIRTTTPAKPCALAIAPGSTNLHAIPREVVSSTGQALFLQR
jgi:hypothetical protein